MQHDLELVAAERVRVLELEVGVLERAPVVGPLVVGEDLLAVQVVHQANTSCTRDARDERVDVLAGGVDGERGARGGLDAEDAHEHLGAVVAGAHADPARADDLGDVVRVHALDGEGHERAARGGVGAGRGA